MILILKNKKKKHGEAWDDMQRFAFYLKKQGVPIKISSLENIELFIKKGSVEALVEGHPLNKYKLVYFHLVGSGQNFVFVLSNMAARKKIKFIDTAYLKGIAAGKLAQTFLIASNNIDVPKTYFSPIYSRVKLRKAARFLGFPIVIKRSFGSHGEGIYLAKNLTEAIKILNKKSNSKIEIILQEFTPNNYDFRVVVFGDNVACVKKRVRFDKKEFRNNVALGSKEIVLAKKDIPAKIIRPALRAARLLGVQVAGVDVVIDPQGKAKIFEVNKAPAFIKNEKISPEIKYLADYLSILYKNTAKNT